MSGYKLVVAHFNESLDWVNDSSFESIIYHKGNNCTFENCLPNIGREAHTYLTYIYDNYDRLTDYTIFCQGKPHDHFPNINNFLKSKDFSDLAVYTNNIVLLCQPPAILHCDRTGLPHMYPQIDVGAESDRLFASYIETFPFTPGAQFIIPKENILARSREFYRQCLLADWNYNPMNFGVMAGGPMACIYERLWLTIFNPDIPERF